jgi:two-component system nitrogen regulation sensor histidine kinase NtrY
LTGPGRIERRLAAAIVLTALIPLLGAIYLASSMVRQTSERFFVPEIGARLDEALGLYQELARLEKTAMRNEATAVAEAPEVIAATAAHDPAIAEAVLQRVLAAHPNLVSLTLSAADKKIASVDRGRPIDDAKELTLEVHRPIGSHAALAAAPDDADDDGPELAFVFAADRSRYEGGLDRMSKFVDEYGNVAARRKTDERTYLLVFAALLGVSIIAAIGVGTLVARGVATRVMELAEATRKAGAGDLTTRVPETGKDELADLSRAFNRMLAEIETTRARIEYLQRIGAWQEMARRLAHEIKNPLTPIRLAVEEVHQRYSGEDAQYKHLLDATLEVVEAEVGTLRRLVGEFSDFARLPQAKLEPADLVAFLKEQSTQALLVEENAPERADVGAPARVTVTFDLQDGIAPVHLDRQMFRRILVNLVRNSAQAIRDQGRAEGRVKVTLRRSNDFWTLDVDDDGPGVPEASRERIFDPYVTTKQDGTGLGLAIVKKIIVEHGGGISALDGPLGGVRMRIIVPADGTKASIAALNAEPEPDLEAIHA